MPIQTIYDVGDDYQITPFMDAGVYGSAIVDAVIKGIGDEFTLDYSMSSLDVTFLAGSEAVVCGSFFKITGNSPITVTLPANKTVYLCARIDLSRNNGSRGYFATVGTSETVYTTTNINGNGTIHDLILYQITTTSTGVGNVKDMRVIHNNNNSTVAGYAIVVLSQQEYDALQVYNSQTLYFIY